MKEKSIKINAILNSIRVAMSLIFPLITFPYTSRILGATNIGKVQFGASIITYISLIAMLGITAYAVREGSPIRNDKAKFQRLANQVFTINMITTVIAYVVLAIILIIPTKLSSYRAIILIQSLSILFTTIGVDWIYTIYEDYAYITKKSIVTQLLSLVLLFIFIKDSEDYYIYALISVIAGASTNIFNFLYAKEYCKLRLTTKLDIKKHLKPMLILFSNELAIKTYINSDVIILGFLANDYVVGLYSVSVKVYTMVKSLINAFIGVTVPRLAVYNSEENKDKYNLLASNILKTVITFVIPAILGINILSKEIITIISGTEYMQAETSLRILSFALVFAVLGNFIVNGILIIHKKEKKVLEATVIAAISNILLNFIFIPIFAQDGAAITTVIAEAIVVIITYMYSRKLYKFPGITSIFLKSCCGCIFIAIYSYIIKFYVTDLTLSIITIITGSVTIYGLIQIITKNEIVLYYLDNIKQKLMKKIKVGGDK